MAWIGAVFIGLLLGLLGSGGSILTVPILIYFVGEPTKLAIAESLVIVGSIAAVGLLPHLRNGNLSWPHVLLFGLPGMLGSYAGAYVSQWIPTVWQMGIFALVLLIAANFMLQPPKAQPSPPRAPYRLGLDGLLVGILSGIVGVGGGFLIVPALILVAGLPVNKAIGTSMAIIALNASSGFFKYRHLLDQQGLVIHWHLVGLFAVLGIAGSLIGSQAAGHIPQITLKRGFAGFLILMGGFVFYQNLPKLLHG